VQKVYRAIRQDADGKPWLSDLVAKGLGVREGVDIFPDDEGVVHPGKAGPSVCGRPKYIPLFLRDEPIWELDTNELPEYLVYKEDTDKPPGRHGFIAPAYAMDLSDYQDAIAETRDLWVQVSPVR
jgi:hypothetical protein